MSWTQSAKTAVRFAKLAVAFNQSNKVVALSPRIADLGRQTARPSTLLAQSPEICILPHLIRFTNAPSPLIKKEISDPLSVLIKKSPSVPKNDIGFSLPNMIDKEVVEPEKNVIEKRAARLIVIRRAKMKKHKWRKLQKRMKFHFAKKRQKRELKKEKEFQAVLLAQVKEAERFDVESYIADKIKIAHWEKPITRVKGFYAPDWVIRDYLQEKTNKRKLNDRIEDCLRMRKWQPK